ncbi:MAG TPA: serine/threonine-protein kinase [Rhizobium sp.]|nr:serine/threonine-protein kinase [Rhizobium sp.]
MTHDGSDSDFEEIASHFSALWRALTQTEEGPRSPEARKILADRIRDALDRGEARLADTKAEIVANSFLLEALVHDGASTQIYRARHRDLNTPYAVKLLRPDHADDPVARKLLLREAEIGMTICHPNVAAAKVALRLADGRPALVMEWAGHRLADRLAHAPLSLRDVVTTMLETLSGLGAIHAAGFVHCDLSPANLLSADQAYHSLKITDLGIALEIGRRHGELDLAFAGRPQFASPEQKAGEALDARADLYSAGLLLSGLLRHSRASHEETEELEAISKRLSQPDPGDRPANAGAALRLFDNLSSRWSLEAAQPQSARSSDIS